MSYDPWQTLSQMPNLTLAITRLPAGDSWWLPEDEAIVLDDRLTQAEQRCALEHELQHVQAGDRCLHGPDARRQQRRCEQRTDDRAAKQLIELEALADALVWCLGYDELAEYLNVDRRTVRARVQGLTESEKSYIERRIAAKGDSA